MLTSGFTLITMHFSTTFMSMQIIPSGFVPDKLSNSALESKEDKDSSKLKDKKYKLLLKKGISMDHKLEICNVVLRLAWGWHHKINGPYLLFPSLQNTDCSMLFLEMELLTKYH